MLLLLLSQLANAGGYYFTESGIVSAGRAGAWVAGADTQFAQYHNPAGLIRVDAPTVSAGISAVQQGVTFDRVDEGGEALPTAKNQDPPFSVPQLGFVTPVHPDVSVALGFTSPFAPSYGYDRDGAQRYGVVDTTIWQFAGVGSVAVRPKPWLTVGASAGIQALRVDYDLVVTTSGPDNEGHDNPNGDVGAAARTWDRGRPLWNAGVLFEPHEQVSIGASFTPPVSFRARGPGELDFTGHALEGSLDQAVWTDDDVSLAVDLPTILRLGVAVRPVPTVEIELAGSWEDWSSLADLEIADIDVTVTSESLNIERDVPDTLSIPSDFRDVFSARLGGEWRLHEQAELRAGIAWDNGSLSPETLSVALVDPWKVQLATGGTVWLLDGRLRLDGMATHVHMPTLHIENSGVTQTGVPVLTPSIDVAVVGNGTMRSHGWTAGIRAAWAFRKAERESPRPLPAPPEAT